MSTLPTVERHDEIISHFRCPDCKAWWSISEFEKQRVRTQQQSMPCPHCRRMLRVDAPALWGATP